MAAAVPATTGAMAAGRVRGRAPAIHWFRVAIRVGFSLGVVRAGRWCVQRGGAGRAVLRAYGGSPDRRRGHAGAAAGEMGRGRPAPLRWRPVAAAQRGTRRSPPGPGTAGSAAATGAWAGP